MTTTVIAPTFDEVVRRAGVVGFDAADQRPIVTRHCLRPTDFVSIAEISAALDQARLTPPYLQLVRLSERLPDADLLTTHRCGAAGTSEAFDGALVSAALTRGFTLKANRPDHWHAGTAAQVADLERHLAAQVRPFLFLTPGAEQGLSPHRDAAHVFVVQLDGEKEWTLWDDGVVTSGHGLVEHAEPAQQFVLAPGDALYLPHGHPHSARAVGGASLHISFTLTAVTPESLAEGLVAGATGESVDDVLTGVDTMLADLDDDAWSATALAAQRDADRPPTITTAAVTV